MLHKMILPTQILPQAFDLEWCLSREECLKRLKINPLKQSSLYALVTLPINGILHNITLLFNEQNNLARIEDDLYISQFFEDEDRYEKVEKLTAEYLSHYTHLVNYCSQVLGAANFSGTWEDDGYPKNEVADYLTFWNHPQGGLQIEFEHQDNELPIVVRVACYLISESEGLYSKPK